MYPIIDLPKDLVSVARGTMMLPAQQQSYLKTNNNCLCEMGRQNYIWAGNFILSHIQSSYRVSLEAEVAVPHFGPIINCAVWIKHSPAIRFCAQNWLILHRRQVRSLFQWCVQTSKRNDHPRCFQTAWWPDIPTEAHAIPILVLLNKFLICCHDSPESKELPALWIDFHVICCLNARHKGCCILAG